MHEIIDIDSQKISPKKDYNQKQWLKQHTKHCPKTEIPKSRLKTIVCTVKDILMNVMGWLNDDCVSSTYATEANCSSWKRLSGRLSWLSIFF